MKRFGWLAALAAAAWAVPASAHTGVGATSGLAAGFAHPLLGADHLLAMLAVGLWAGIVGGRAAWAWPLAFVAAMVAGALAGLAGVPLPGVEAGIALSVVVLGAAVALSTRLPVAAGALVCGLFALFHGHAHGAEVPPEAGAAAYVLGFVAATTLLHAAGLMLAFALVRRDRPWLPRLAGGATALAGLVLLIG